MTYDDEVLSAIQTSHITTTFQEVEEVLSSRVEKVEFIPLEEIVFEVFEEPEMVVQIFEEILRGLNAEQKTSESTQGNSQQSGPMGANGEVPAGANPNDPSGVGGGTIGTGNIPQSGEGNFTGGASDS